MKIVKIDNKQIWEELVANHPEANFLQSWQWGKFHKRLGKIVLRYAVEENGDYPALAQAIFERAKRGSYLAIAGGPLVNKITEKYFKYLIDQLALTGKSLGATFIRFRPQIEKTDQLMDWLKNEGFVLSPMHLTTDLTIQLDLTKNEEQLLKEMRKNTRYEIKKSKKIGIFTELSTDPTDLKDFYQRQLKLAKIKGFVPFSEKFLTTQFETFLEDDNVCLIHAYSKNKTLLASAFVIFYNGEAAYHYGVSTEANRKLPGSYACQYRVIKEAKKRGCSRYNLWGVAPEGRVKHRFAGVSLFKRGFGGREVDYIPAHDLPLSKKYFFTKTFEAVRKKMRNL